MIEEKSRTLYDQFKEKKEPRLPPAFKAWKDAEIKYEKRCPYRDEKGFCEPSKTHRPQGSFLCTVVEHIIGCDFFRAKENGRSIRNLVERIINGT